MNEKEPSPCLTELEQSLKFIFFIGGASSLVAQLVKNPFAMQETLGQEDQLEKG